MDAEQGWRSGLPETPCGAGSTLEATTLQRQLLAQWAEEYRFEHVVDVGAGDLNWVRHVRWAVRYEPLDLVPRHPDVRKFDILREVPPKADAVMCLWVLNHLHPADAGTALDNIRLSGSEFLIYTWWPGMHPSLDLGPIESAVIKPHKQAELRLVSL